MIAGNIPNGYGGLRWNNSADLIGAGRTADEGYHAGMVSPNNVAFNYFGSPASISVAGGLFSLESADLTLALNLNTPLDITVLGYRGTIPIRCTIMRRRSLISDYLGIDQATFITSPAQQLAMG